MYLNSNSRHPVRRGQSAEQRFTRGENYSLASRHKAAVVRPISKHTDYPFTKHSPVLDRVRETARSPSKTRGNPGHRLSATDTPATITTSQAFHVATA